MQRGEVCETKAMQPLAISAGGGGIVADTAKACCPVAGDYPRQCNYAKVGQTCGLTYYFLKTFSTNEFTINNHGFSNGQNVTYALGEQATTHLAATTNEHDVTRA